MHPLYRKRKYVTRTIAVVFFVAGVLGIALPFLQGFLFLAVGVMLWSLHSSTMRTLFIRFTRDNEKLSRTVSRVESWLTTYVHLTMHTLEEQRLTDRDPTLALLAEVSEVPQGIAVLLHSASGVKEAPVLEVIAEHYRERGYTVVRFDAGNGLGDSGGAYNFFAARTMCDDLERVLAWVRGREGHAELPLALAGHSIGGMVAAEYAAEHTDAVRELMLFAPTVSGTLLHEHLKRHDPDGYERWQRSGVRPTRHPFKALTRELGWTFLEEVRTHDLLPIASKLTMPVRIIVGEHDRTTLVEDCRSLTAAIGPHARLTVLPAVRHNPVERSELTRVRRTLQLFRRVS